MMCHAQPRSRFPDARIELLRLPMSPYNTTSISNKAGNMTVNPCAISDTLRGHVICILEALIRAGKNITPKSVESAGYVGVEHASNSSLQVPEGIGVNNTGFQVSPLTSGRCGDDS